MHLRSGFGPFTVLCAATVFAAVGCGKNPTSPGGNQPPVFGVSDSVFTDAQVREAAYSLYVGPAGFYSEERPATYTAPLYVSTLSVAPCGSLHDQWIEFSTDDTAQARAWAVASIACESGAMVVAPGPLTVTRRYIEFVTYRPGEGPRHPVRVHRASYLDRSGFDRFHPGASVGRLVVRPIDDAEARGVAEYFWFLSHPYAYPDTKVLSSFTRASSGSVLHTIYFLHRTEAIGLLGPVPVVELLRDDFRIDIASGVITFRETDLRYVGG